MTASDLDALIESLAVCEGRRGQAQCALTAETKAFEYKPATGELVPNKSNSYARVVEDGNGIAILYQRKNHNAIYFRADDLAGAPKASLSKLRKADGNGSYNRAIDVKDAKAAKLADDLLAFVASKAAATKAAKLDGSDEHGTPVKSA